MKVLLVKPFTHPEVVEIEDGLESLQAIVDGTIEAIYPFDDNVCLICNDEGKLLNLDLNRALYDDENAYDVIAGNFIVVGIGVEDFCSLTDEQIERYEKRFHQPEMFLQIDQHIVVLPLADEDVEYRKEKSDDENMD